MEELTVGACAHFINDRRLQVDHHTAGHVLAGPGLTEESVECLKPGFCKRSVDKLHAAGTHAMFVRIIRLKSMRPVLAEQSGGRG